MRTTFLCKECQWKVKVEKCCLVWHNESGLLLFPEKSSCMALHSATGKQMQSRLLHRVPIQSRISFCFGRNPSSRIAFVTSLQRAYIYKCQGSGSWVCESCTHQGGQKIHASYVNITRPNISIFLLFSRNLKLSNISILLLLTTWWT